MQTTVEQPADAAGALYIPTDISPEEVFVAIGRLRQEAQDEIERLLAFLDQTDGDPDLEPSLAGYSPGMDDREAEPEHDEPSLGWTEQEARWGRHSNPADVDTELDDCDDEPSLARTSTIDQTAAQGSSNDCEGDEHNGLEPENEGGCGAIEDDEPSLGWTEEEAARGRTCAGTMGSAADLEEGVGARRPQDRTAIDRKPITVANTYRRFLGGLPDGQKAAVRKRMRPDAKVSLA